MLNQNYAKQNCDIKYIGFGAGNNLSEMNPDFLQGLAYIADNDAQKHGRTIYGVQICPAETLLRENKDSILIFVLSTIYDSEISMQLKGMGFVEGRHYMRAADWRGNDLLPASYRLNHWNERQTQINYEKEKWLQRRKVMSQYIDAAACHSLIDLGCGNMQMEKFLPSGTQYFPVDYIRRDARTIVADFNQYEFPKLHADYAVVSGCLEYVDDWKWFLRNVLSQCTCLVLSYRFFEANNRVKARRNSGWVNDIKLPELIRFIQDQGFALTDSCDFRITTAILKFEKKA